jgi:hypothetical protein
VIGYIEYYLREPNTYVDWVIFMGKKKDYDYIEDIKEWQDHQYDPGYYLGGKIPPYIKSPGNRKYLGLALLIPVFMMVIYWIFASVIIGNVHIMGLEEYPKLESFLGNFGIGAVFIVTIVAGISLLRNPKKEIVAPKKRRRKRK